jgi:hypothetical protein
MKVRRSTQIWNAGLALDAAWYRFADPQLRNSFEQMPGGMETVNSAIEGLEKLPPAAMIGTFFGAVSSGLQQSQQRDNLIVQMQSVLLIDLFNSQLIATGYRPGGRDPLQIDPDLFDDPDIDWNKSILRSRGQEYLDVRITDPADIPPLNSERNRDRGSRAAIIAAIDRVALRIPEFCKLNRGEAAQLVRDEIGIEYSSGNGLSDQNIIKLIVAKCGSKRIRNN